MDQNELLRRAFENSFTQAREARSLAWDTRHTHQLLARALGEEPWGGMDDARALVSQIRTLVLDGDKVPFFTEDRLYDLIGKENARTVLALMNTVIEELEGRK